MIPGDPGTARLTGDGGPGRPRVTLPPVKDPEKSLPVEGAAREEAAPSANQPWFGRMFLVIGFLNILTGSWFAGGLMLVTGIGYLNIDRLNLLTGHHPLVSVLQVPPDTPPALLEEGSPAESRCREVAPIPPGEINARWFRPARWMAFGLPVVLMGSILVTMVLTDGRPGPLGLLLPMGLLLGFLASTRYRMRRVRGGGLLERNQELAPFSAGARWVDRPGGPALVVAAGAHSTYGSWGADLDARLTLPDLPGFEATGTGGWRNEDPLRPFPMTGKYYWVSFEVPGADLPASGVPLAVEVTLSREDEVVMRHRVHAPGLPSG